jgi:hypothetical protein
MGDSMAMKMFGIAAVAAVTLAAAATAAAAQNVGSGSGIAQPRHAVADHSNTANRAKASKRSAAARSSGAFASAPSATASRARAARTAFDGIWSVLVVSREGACNATFRYGVEISNGNVLNAGGAQVAIDGRVAPSGVIQVSVAASGQQALGVGRLSRTLGSGTWQGQGSAGFCAGIWQAERRG